MATTKKTPTVKKSQSKTKEEVKPVEVLMTCFQFTNSCNLDKAGKLYISMKYKGQEKTKSEWEKIIKQDRIVY